MLWTLAVIFVLLWALGVVSAYTFGGFIHVLVGLAVAVLVIRMIKGRGRKAQGHGTAG